MGRMWADLLSLEEMMRTSFGQAVTIEDSWFNDEQTEIQCILSIKGQEEKYNHTFSVSPTFRLTWKGTPKVI